MSKPGSGSKEPWPRICWADQSMEEDGEEEEGLGMRRLAVSGVEQPERDLAWPLSRASELMLRRLRTSTWEAEEAGLDQDILLARARKLWVLSMPPPLASLLELERHERDLREVREKVR